MSRRDLTAIREEVSGFKIGITIPAEMPVTDGASRFAPPFTDDTSAKEGTRRESYGAAEGGRTRLAAPWPATAWRLGERGGRAQQMGCSWNIMHVCYLMYDKMYHNAYKLHIYIYICRTIYVIYTYV